MKNKFLTLAAFAGLAAAAITVACNKTDMEEPTSNETRLKTKRQFVPITAHFFWKDPQGGPCLEHQYSDSLCYIGMYTIDDPSNPYQALVSINQVDQMIIKSYYNAPIDTRLKQVFDQLLSDGSVLFGSDCYLVGENFNVDHIPAGEYPVYMQDGNLVIDFSN